MACYSPISIRRGEAGAGYVGPGMALKVKCGQCIGCRLERKRDWAVRCMHEAMVADEDACALGSTKGSNSCFLTLTYDREHLPPHGTLVKKHWQDFAKKVRNHHGPFRFMHCGEYGEKGGRPHYHALVFGHDFSEDSVKVRTRGEHELRASESLSKLWPHGLHAIGRVSWDSAAYVASYTTKKASGDVDDDYYDRGVDVQTGEVHQVVPEYATMSRRPGLGTEFFKRYSTDMFPRGTVVLEGREFPVPEFYLKLLEKEDPELCEKVRERRKDRVRKNWSQNTAERLALRERVAKRKIAHSRERSKSFGRSSVANG